MQKLPRGVVSEDTIGRIQNSFDANVLGISLKLDNISITTPIDSPESLAGLFESLAKDAKACPGGILHEKVFIHPEAVERVRAARAKAYEEASLDPDLPWTCVVAEPCVGGYVAGVQRWTLQSETEELPRVETVRLHGSSIGRIVNTGTERVLFMSDVNGIGNNASHQSAKEQCRVMFDRAGEVLRANRFTFRDVARTWIYSARLLEWYDELNEVRSNFFEHEGVRCNGQPFVPPASTGIQGCHPAGAEVFMDVIAVQDLKNEQSFEPMHTVRQNEAFDYGSDFSRGMSVGQGAKQLLMVSGTASIDPEGRSIYIGDSQAQLCETYLNTAAVLRESGATLFDTAMALLFFKDEVTWKKWCEMRELGGLPDLPAISVFADVCRDDLLFEMEVTACAPAQSKATDRR